MSKIRERLRKVEGARTKASALPQLVAWWNLDGSYRHNGTNWPSVEAIREAHQGKYAPGDALIFTWKRGAA